MSNARHDEQTELYKKLAGLSRHERRLVESSNLRPELAIALVHAIESKGARQRDLEQSYEQAEAARAERESAEEYRLAEHERLTEMARINDELFRTWQSVQEDERVRRETWTPPPPMGQLRP